MRARVSKSDEQEGNADLLGFVSSLPEKNDDDGQIADDEAQNIDGLMSGYAKKPLINKRPNMSRGNLTQRMKYLVTDKHKDVQKLRY